MLSCSQKDYTIKGRVADGVDLEGATVLITELDGYTWNVLDSAVVKKGRFSFEGDLVEPLVVYLRYNYPTDKVNTKSFILEKGKTNLLIDANGNLIVSGTELNDRLQAYRNDKVAIENRIEEIQGKLQNDKELSEDEIAKLREELSQSEDKVRQNIVDHTKKNANNLVGKHLLLTTHHSLNAEQKQEVLDSFSEETLQDEAIQGVVELLEFEKRIIARLEQAADAISLNQYKQVAAGKQYIDFTQTTPSGASLSLSDLVGKTDYLLIDFWASWCGPCIRSFPALKDFYEINKGNKLKILGVSLDSKDGEWKSAIATHNLNWEHVSDLRYWDNAAAKLYGVRSIPTTILIDKDGKIVGRNLSLSEINRIINVH